MQALYWRPLPLAQNIEYDTDVGPVYLPGTAAVIFMETLVLLGSSCPKWMGCMHPSAGSAVLLHADNRSSRWKASEALGRRNRQRARQSYGHNTTVVWPLPSSSPLANGSTRTSVNVKHKVTSRSLGLDSQEYFTSQRRQERFPKRCSRLARRHRSWLKLLS